MNCTESLLDLPNNYAIYVFYQRGVIGSSVYYIGSGSELRKNVVCDLFDSNITRRERYHDKKYKPNKVTEVRWWLITRDEYGNWDHHIAEMVIINEILKPKISRSNYLSDEARRYYKNKEFRSFVEFRIMGAPDGCYKILSLAHEQEAILKLRARIIKLINDPIAKELEILNDEEIDQITNYFWLGAEPEKTINFAYYLAYEHHYRELLLEDQNVIKYVGFSLALGWIGSKLGETHNSRDLVSAYSVLLGKDYKLNFDIEAMYSEMYQGVRVARLDPYRLNLTTEPPEKEPTVPYSKFFEIWPEFKKLKDASIQAKKGLVIIILRICGDTGFVPALQLPNINSLRQGLIFLVKNKLVNVFPTPIELLGCLTYKELRDFALSQGLEIHRKKRKLIQTISSQENPDEITSFVHNMVIIDNPIRPNSENLMLLSKHIKNEMDRINFFRLWLEYKIYSPKYPFAEQVASPERSGDRYIIMKFPESMYLQKVSLPISTITQEDQNLIEEYWDENYDCVLERMIYQYKTKIPIDEATLQIIRAMKNQGKLEAYKKDINGNVFGSFYWRNVLSKYIGNKLLANHYYQLSSDRKICNGCEKIFVENSVFISNALRVGKKINFCNPCYINILGHEHYADNRETIKQSDDEMLSHLFELAKALDGIPTQSFMKNIDLSNYSNEKQIQIGIALLKMPSYRIYLQRFKTWLSCLDKAGILKDGYWQTSRGIQCLAKDGHLCLSLGEKEIDDWLSSRNIPHEKEIRYPYDSELNPSELQRCDWKIADIYVEYAGMMSDHEYSMKMKDKTLLSERHNLHLVILYPDDLGRLEEKLGFLISSVINDL